MVNLGVREGLGSLAFVFQNFAGKLLHLALNLCTQHFAAPLCFLICAFLRLLIYDYK